MKPESDPAVGSLRRIEVLDIWPATATATAAAPRRPGPASAPDEPAGTVAPPTEETFVAVIDHLTTLSSLVTQASAATSAELAALQERIEGLAADLLSLRQDLQAARRTEAAHSGDIRQIA